MAILYVNAVFNVLINKLPVPLLYTFYGMWRLTIVVRYPMRVVYRTIRAPYSYLKRKYLIAARRRQRAKLQGRPGILARMTGYVFDKVDNFLGRIGATRRKYGSKWSALKHWAWGKVPTREEAVNAWAIGANVFDKVTNIQESKE